MKKYVFYFVLVFIVVALCFDKFMTYDRSYTWSKEYKNEIEVIARKNGFKIEKTDKIPIQSIKRSFEKIIKIKIKDFGGEFGENTVFYKLPRSLLYSRK